ncbi:MAG: CoA transferase, partial [Chloroflexi bacterium]|nr:CoA transferase [Chloroflexota bacterium]
DQVVQAKSGLMYLPGRPEDPPLSLGFPAADLVPSVFAVAGLLAALYERQRSGRGRHVDIAMYDCMLAANERAMGLGWAHLREINPALVYVSISGFGHRDVLPGPYWDRPAYDQVIQAMSGLMYMPGKPGDPPIPLGLPLADLVPSVFAVAGLLAALYERQRTGRGRHVDIAMYDCMLAANERALGLLGVLGGAPARGQGDTSAQLGIFAAADGYVAIGIVTQAAWPAFCRALGREDLLADPRVGTPEGRPRHVEEVLRPAIEGWARDKTREQVVEACLAAGVACGAVRRVEEVYACPQTAARQMLLEMAHPVAGKVRVAGNPLKMSGVDAVDARRPPELGEHTADVLASWLGYAAADVAALRAAGAL